MTTLATWVKVNGQGDFLGKVKGQRPKLAVKILEPGRRRKNRVYGSETPLRLYYILCMWFLNVHVCVSIVELTQLQGRIERRGHVILIEHYQNPMQK